MVVDLNEEDTEINKIQISQLLACLRVRANAIQTSDWELVTEEDLDHLEMARQALSYIKAGSGDVDSLYRIATYVQSAYQYGHNTVKFTGK